jgi:hypothetical protein
MQKSPLALEPVPMEQQQQPLVGKAQQQPVPAPL